MRQDTPSQGRPAGIRVRWHQLVPGIEAIPGSLIPDPDAGDLDLGTVDERWATVYAGVFDADLAAFDYVFEARCSAQINHGLTQSGLTDSFFNLSRFNDAEGGAYMAVIAEDAAVATVFGLDAFGGTASTTKSTAGRSLIEFAGHEHDNANNLADVTADGNVFGVRARVGGSNITLAIVDVNGDLWLNGSVDLNAGIALGGGAGATLGTIGGSGPTAAAQAQWVQIKVGGTTHWIPAWT